MKRQLILALVLTLVVIALLLLTSDDGLASTDEQTWNPMAGYWTPWYTVKSGYCGQEACYVDVMTDLWGVNTKRIHLVYWVHRDTHPRQHCRFGGFLYGRYRRAECKF